MNDIAPSSHWRRTAPALTLIVLSPMVAEVLPRATRFSSLFVVPMEMCVWGGGALLIRASVRLWQLGWRNMLLLALCLAVAEECAVLFLIRRWAADYRFQAHHEFALIFGTMLGSMIIGFIGFIGAAPVDLYFKIFVNILAIALLIALGIRVRRQTARTA
jgi:hypothetical protein